MNSSFHRLVAVILFILGIVGLTTTIVHAMYYSPEREVDVGFATPLANPAKPSKLIIPKIDLSTDVEEVGITFKGNMSTPKEIYNVGWYKYGTIPGMKGSSVIDVHVDNGLALPGVFNNLKELNIGDDIFIQSEDHAMIHFVVIDKQTYDYKQVPLELVFERNDGAYLNLITCDGDWVAEDQTDDKRIIVYAKLAT